MFNFQACLLIIRLESEMSLRALMGDVTFTTSYSILSGSEKSLRLIVIISQLQLIKHADIILGKIDGNGGEKI